CLSWTSSLRRAMLLSPPPGHELRHAHRRQRCMPHEQGMCPGLLGTAETGVSLYNAPLSSYSGLFSLEHRATSGKTLLRPKLRFVRLLLTVARWSIGGERMHQAASR